MAREDDSATLATIESLRLEPLPFPIVRGVVREPGFMPPVEEGVRLASGEIIAMLDDDGEAEPGWTDGLLRHYRDPLVGAAGGRYINMKGDVAVPVESTRRVGYVNSLGGFVGRMYLRPDFDDAVAVDFLMGGCMSYRATVARVLEFDRALNGDVAFGYEVDLGLQVRRAGWKIVFDPAVAIRHYSAPRAHTGMRAASGASIRAYAFNHLRVIVRRLSGPRRILATAWQVLVGERRAPGLLPWALGPLSRRADFDVSFAPAAWSGRRDALASWMRPAA